MDTILHNSKCLFTREGRLEIYDHKLATKLNRYLKKYDNGHYTFVEGEEACYKIKPSDFDYIMRNFLTKAV